MSDSGPVEQPDSIPWWKDKAILAALTPIVAGILKMIQINFGPWITTHLGLAINTWTADDTLTYIGSVGGFIAGVYLVRRRVRHGKDPANPSLLITGGAIAQRVIGAEPKPEKVVDEFGQVVEQMNEMEARNPILRVESDPASPRLKAESQKFTPTIGAAITEEEQARLFHLMHARDRLEKARADALNKAAEPAPAGKEQEK